MGKLTSLLKKHETVSTKSVIESVKNNILKEEVASKKETVSPETKGGVFELTKEEFEIVKNSVVEIDTTDRKRKDIIIGMYGSIKNPKTGERFNIPSLSWDDEEYTYQYANYMKTLVNRPDEFKKVMNWE